MTWDRVDWEGGVVRLDVGQTKTGAGRVFPFAAFPDLDVLLRRQRDRTDAAQRQQGCVIPWVFHRAGECICSFDNHWRKACERAGLVGLLVHDLRRTAIRNLVRAGVPEKTAMTLSGHKTRAIFDRYDIVDEQDLKDGVKKLAAFAKAQARRRERRVLPIAR